MVKQRTFSGAMLGGVLLVGGATLAWAHHGESSPQLVNRYVFVTLQPDRVDVKVSLFFGQIPAGEERRLLDTNGDGRLAQDELAAGRARWAHQAPQLAQVLVDGDEVPLTVVEFELGTEKGVGAAALDVAVGGSRPLTVTGGPHEIRVLLGPDVPRAGSSEILLETSPSWKLEASRQTTGPDELRPRYTFEPTLSQTADDRAITFVVRPRADHEASPAASGPSLGLLAGMLALLAGGVLLIRRRVERRSVG